MTTRATIIRRAFGRLGVSDYMFEVTPDERADARLELDAMLAEWAGNGVDLGNTPDDGNDNDAAEMTTPTYADAAIWNNLALRIAPDFGKTPSGDLRRDAARGYDLCSAKTTVIPTMQRTTQLRGGGDRYYRRYGLR